MLSERFYDVRLICDKCGRLIRKNIHIIGPKVRAKYRKKKTFCGRCIQERIHRNDPSFDFDAEFSYSWKSLTDNMKYLYSIKIY